MLNISAPQIEATLNYPELTEELRLAFQSPVITPLRAHHALPGVGDAPEATWLVMPAWDDATRNSDLKDTYIGLKSVTVFPDNGKKNLPTIMGLYILLSGDSGQPLAILDGKTLTLWRTACASALAASYLATKDASQMLMVGAGALAPYLIRAHAAVRPLKQVKIWNRTHSKAVELANSMAAEMFDIEPVESLEAATREADIISCATISETPLIYGRWLKPGAHLDLVGGFRPDLRECDDEAVKSARIFVDTRTGAMSEAGDLVQPLEKGIISPQNIIAELSELTRGTIGGRQTNDEKTLFKSVGTALEDLAAAKLVYRKIA